MLEEIAIGPVLTTQPWPQATPPVTSAVASASPTTSTPGYVTPSSGLNSQVGIVVIQYRNTSGNVEFSIPTKQQLDAYAANALKGFGVEDSTTA